MNSKDKKIILEYFEGNRLMTLGTVSRGKPWGATVFFAFDARLNIFFYSRLDTKHAAHIAKNSSVSVVINQDYGTVGRVKGMQIVGSAALVPEKDLKKCYTIYRKRFSWADDFKGDHRLYVVRPAEIYYIDQKRFGHFFRVKMK